MKDTSAQQQLETAEPAKAAHTSDQQRISMCYPMQRDAPGSRNERAYPAIGCLSMQTASALPWKPESPPACKALRRDGRCGSRSPPDHQGHLMFNA